MSSTMRVALVAEEAAGVEALRAMARTPHQIVAVLTRLGGVGPLPVARAARGLSIPLWPAEDVRDPALGTKLSDSGIDLLLNVHSLYLATEAVLRAPRVGCFNLHPGPLPEYAGLNTVSWAILQGEREYGVTVHRMEPRVDSGAIAYQERFEVDCAGETALSLMHKCVRAGVPLLVRLLEQAAVDPAAIPAVAQDLSRRRYYGRGVPHHGRLDWRRSAGEICNFIRASDYGPFPSPWGRPSATVGAREVHVLSASSTAEQAGVAPGTVGPTTASGILVAAGDEWVVVRRVMADGVAHDASDILKPGDHFDLEHEGRAVS